MFQWTFFSFLAYSIGMSLCNREASVVRLSVCLSVCPSICPSVNFAQIASSNTEVAGSPPNFAHDGPQKSPHPGCAQGQGQRSRDTDTFVI